jgi:hypothetical protein
MEQLKMRRFSGSHTGTSYQDIEEKSTRSLEEDLLYKGSYKIFIQELPMSIPEELSYKHP